MTYNVNFALADDRATRDVIGAGDADVVLRWLGGSAASAPSDTRSLE